MKNIVVLIFAIFLSSFVSAADMSDFALSVKPVNTALGPQLRMELKNVSSSPKVVFQGALPWTDGVSGARLTGFSGSLEEGDTTLKPVKAVGAVFNSLAEIVIEPGASLVGNIALEERFPGMKDLLRREAVFMYWVYVPIDASLKKNRELVGAVFLQKRSE